jgi:hypothetical protein
MDIVMILLAHIHWAQLMFTIFVKIFILKYLEKMLQTNLTHVFDLHINLEF